MKPDEYWSMLPCEFWLMCKGYNEHKNKERDLIRDIAWSMMQQHAAWTAFSTKQSKAISRQKPPWKKGRTREDGKPEVLNYDDMKGMFEGLAEKRKN